MSDDIEIKVGSDPTGVESGSKRAKVAIKGVADEGKELDGALRRLKSAIDPTFAAQEKLNQKLATAKRLLDANKISKKEYTQATQLYRQELNKEVAALERNSLAGKQAAAAAKKAKQEEVAAARKASQEKIAAAREERKVKERLEQQEQQAIKAAASLARQAALDARKAAKAPSARAVGKVSPSTGEASRSIKQLENDITRAMAKAERLSQRAADQATRAAQASTAKIAQIQSDAATRTAAKATETQQRVVQLERQKASQIAQVKQQEVAAEKATAAASREAARAAAEAGRAKKAAAAKAASAAREAAAETERQARAERQAANAANELRASIDPVFASQQRYNESMRRATELLMQNKLAQGEFMSIQKQAKAQMDINTRSLGRQNATYVQLGYQAQDVTASLASGISPLVILAQQGGQTASAMSQMGGKIGKVAAFFAGPWGAAIIGATLLLGFFLDATKKSGDESKKAKEKTLDLKNAEEVRKASLDKLNKALQEFNKQQREANNNRAEGIRLEGIAARSNLDETTKRLTKAQKELNKAQKAYDLLESSGPTMDTLGNPDPSYYGALTTALGKVKAAEREVELATQARGAAQESVDNNRARIIERQAEAATDASAKITQAWEKETAAALRRYNASAKTRKDEKRYLDELIEANNRRAASEERLSEATSSSGTSTSKSRSGTPREDAQRAADYASSQGFRPGTVGRNGVSTGAGHQNGRAVDINIDGYGRGRNEADFEVARARMDKLALDYQKMGYTVLWNGKRYAATGGITVDPKIGHADHLHVEAPTGGAYVKGVSEAANEAADARIEAAERMAEELARARKELLDNEMEDLGYAQQMAGNDYQLQLDLQDEKIQALREYYGAESREVLRASRERVEIERRKQEALLETQQQGIEDRLALSEINAEGDRDVELAEQDQQSDNADFMANNGQSPEAALERRAQLLDQEYQLEQSHEQRMYQLRVSAIQQQLALANLPAERRAELMRDLEQMEAEHLSNRRAAQADYARDVNQIQLESAQLVNDKWNEVVGSFTQGLGSAMQGLWTKSMTFQQAMINMADQMVYKFFDAGTQMLEDWIMKQVGMTTVQQVQDTARTVSTATAETAKTGAVLTNTGIQTGAKVGAAATEQTVEAVTVGAKVASEAIKAGAAVTGAGVSTAATAAASGTEIVGHAATAAAGAFKSTVVIPFIGPVAAPLAAAGALAAVLGFGALVSSRGGLGEVGMDGQPAILHKKETVLPAWIAEPMRQMFVSPGRSGSGMVSSAASAGSAARTEVNGGSKTFNFQPQYVGAPEPDLNEMLRKQGRDFKRWLKQEVRNGSITLDGR